MSISSFVKTIQDIMRNDAGVNGDAQRIEQLSWILFLKVYDDREKVWEIRDEKYQSIIPEKYKWRNWAIDDKDGDSLTGDDLLQFVNSELLPTLKKLDVDENTPIRKEIVRATFEDTNNYMKNGVLLRKVLNVVNEVDFNDPEERHLFNDIYEKILKDLQSAGNAGEYYTPRAATDFIAEVLEPKLGERMADFACGTGGFLTSTLKLLEQQVDSVEGKEKYNHTVYGIEKKGQPYLLAVTNLLIHGIDDPDIMHGNSLERKVTEYKEKEKFDLIMMNPPFGGSELPLIKMNFPSDLQSSETADLFMSVIMYRLKENGRAGVIVPDGFLFGTDNAKVNIKKKMLTEFNLHTVIRLPHSVFAPYTGIHTNILFFEKTQPTSETWFYRLDMPEGYKNFSKTKPMKSEHFNPVREWWKNREAITIDGFDKAKSYTPAEIGKNNYSLDLCGFPQEEEIILEPQELMTSYINERTELNQKIDRVLTEIQEMLEGEK